MSLLKKKFAAKFMRRFIDYDKSCLYYTNEIINQSIIINKNILFTKLKKYKYQSILIIKS